MPTNEITLIGAYGAGLVSFLAPCLLPLLPSYFSAITGFTFADLYGMQFHHMRSRVVIGSIFFILGFSAVYSLLGVTGSVIGQSLGGFLPLLLRFSGVVLIFLGLMQLGILHLPGLRFDSAWNVQRRLTRLGIITAFVTGLVAALSWIPCITPTLTPILLLASTKQSVLEGGFLLFIFSLGIGTPFLITGLFFPYIIKSFQTHRLFFHLLSLLAGIIMIVFGTLLLFNFYNDFINFMRNFIGNSVILYKEPV